MRSVRRSDFDVTNTVQVSSPDAVLTAIKTLFHPTWPTLSFEPLEDALQHFERLFAGDVPGYMGVDTVYHDRQHTLDITLALARLLVGYERQPRRRKHAWVAPALWWGCSPACSTTWVTYVGWMTVRSTAPNLPAPTFHGVRAFSREYLPVLGLAHAVPIATEIIHFTGYEVPFARIKVSGPASTSRWDTCSARRT